MAYYDNNEHASRIVAVQNILHQKNLDFALIYYDEYNLGNGWYLTAWCPQFESGTVLVPARGKPMILGGPESEPFAKQDSAVKETRNLPVFMVPDEEYPNATIITFADLFREISAGGIRRVGLVGADQMPVSVYTGIREEFRGGGLGKEFFAWAEGEYPQARRFRLEATPSNQRAMDLYRRLGFEPLHYVQMVRDRTGE